MPQVPESVNFVPDWYCPHCGAQLVAVEAIESCWNCKADFLARGVLPPTRIVPRTPVLPTDDILKSIEVGRKRITSGEVQLGTGHLRNPGRGLTLSAVISAAVLLVLVGTSNSIGSAGQGWGGAAFVLFFPFIAAVLVVASAALSAIYVLPLVLILRRRRPFNPLTSAAIATLPFVLFAILTLHLSFSEVARNPGGFASFLALLSYPFALSLSFAYVTLPPSVEIKSGRVDRLVAIVYLTLALATFVLLSFLGLMQHQ
jgi:hypothetical protein